MKNSLFLLLLSCFVLQAIAQQNSGTAVEKVVSAGTESRIALLSIKISNTENKYTIKLNDASVIMGGEHKINRKNVSWTENDLLGFVLDGERMIVDTLVIQDPLRVKYEYPDDNGSFAWKEVDLKTNDILIKFLMDKRMQFLQVMLVESGNRLKAIETLTLPDWK